MSICYSITLLIYRDTNIFPRQSHLVFWPVTYLVERIYPCKRVHPTKESLCVHINVKDVAWFSQEISADVSCQVIKFSPLVREKDEWGWIRRGGRGEHGRVPLKREIEYCRDARLIPYKERLSQLVICRPIELSGTEFLILSRYDIVPVYIVRYWIRKVSQVCIV